MAKTGNEIEHCAKCNSEDLCYSHIPIVEGADILYFDYECNECGHKGQEVYKLKFSHTN